VYKKPEIDQSGSLNQASRCGNTLCKVTHDHLLIYHSAFSIKIMTCELTIKTLVEKSVLALPRDRHVVALHAVFLDMYIWAVT
jgi:hypothetical protein